MVQEYAVHCLAHILVGAESVRQIAYAAAHLSSGEIGLYPLYRAQEVEGRASALHQLVGIGRAIAAVDHRAHSEHVGVENYVVGSYPRLIHKQTVGPRAHLGTAPECHSLAILVECHHHDGGTHVAHVAGMSQKCLLALLKAYGVDYRASLYALESRHYRLP